jgi:KipI family sensor histidine kinase inhibitor
MRLLPCGDRAVLLDCADLDEARRWHAALDDVATDVVMGASTVLLRGDPSQLRDLVERTEPADDLAALDAPEIEVPVVYDGADLDDVARLLGLDRDAVVAAHTGTPWTAAFGGFAPGFSYLTGGDPRLHVPRRDTPRTRVPAGAVGLAGEFSGVYPRSSPGGWQLIGRTDLPMWDSTRQPAALLLPGTVVRFVEVS